MIKKSPAALLMAGAKSVTFVPLMRFFNFSRVWAGVIILAPIASMMVRAFVTSCALLA